MYNSFFDDYETDAYYQEFNRVLPEITSPKSDPFRDCTNSYVFEVSDDAHISFFMPNLNEITLLLANEYKLSKQQIEIIVEALFDRVFDDDSREDVAKFVRIVYLVLKEFAIKRKDRINCENWIARSKLNWQMSVDNASGCPF